MFDKTKQSAVTTAVILSLGTMSLLPPAALAGTPSKSAPQQPKKSQPENTSGGNSQNKPASSRSSGRANAPKSPISTACGDDEGCKNDPDGTKLNVRGAMGRVWGMVEGAAPQILGGLATGYIGNKLLDRNKSNRGTDTAAYNNLLRDAQARTQTPSADLYQRQFENAQNQLNSLRQSLNGRSGLSNNAATEAARQNWGSLTDMSTSHPTTSASVATTDTMSNGQSSNENGTSTNSANRTAQTANSFTNSRTASTLSSAAGGSSNRITSNQNKLLPDGLGVPTVSVDNGSSNSSIAIDSNGIVRRLNAEGGDSVTNIAHRYRSSNAIDKIGNDPKIRQSVEEHGLAAIRLTREDALVKQAYQTAMNDHTLNWASVLDAPRLPYDAEALGLPRGDWRVLGGTFLIDVQWLARTEDNGIVFRERDFLTRAEQETGQPWTLQNIRIAGKKVEMPDIVLGEWKSIGHQRSQPVNYLVDTAIF